MTNPSKKLQSCLSRSSRGSFLLPVDSTTNDELIKLADTLAVKKVKSSTPWIDDETLLATNVNAHMGISISAAIPRGAWSQSQASEDKCSSRCTINSEAGDSNTRRNSLLLSIPDLVTTGLITSEIPTQTFEDVIPYNVEKELFSGLR